MFRRGALLSSAEALDEPLNHRVHLVGNLELDEVPGADSHPNLNVAFVELAWPTQPRVPALTGFIALGCPRVPALAVSGRQENQLVAPAGFEPAISALRGLRPRPLDDGATLRDWWAALGLNQ